MKNESKMCIRPPAIGESKLEQKLAEQLRIREKTVVPPRPQQGKDARYHKYPRYYRRPLAYVTNFMEKTVSLLEIPTRSKILDISVGPYPYGIDISSDQRFIYVSNMGDNSLSVICTRINQVVHTIHLNTVSFPADRPNGVKVSPDGRFIYVANETSHNLSVVDAKHMQVVTVVELPDGSAPVQLDISNDGRLAFVTLRDCESKNVAVVDLKVNLPIKYINVGFGPVGIAAARRNPLVLTTSSYNYSMSAINTILAESSPNDIALGIGVYWDVVFNRSDSIAYVSDYADGANCVKMVDVFSHQQTGKIIVGKLPKGLALSADGRLLVVCNAGDNTVSVIDTSSNQVMYAILAGTWPQYAAILN